jgi:Transcriptional regulatory protein, C terminal
MGTSRFVGGTTFNAVWGEETHVDFRDGMHYCIGQIRAVLGDNARAPHIIVTVPKRGYRLNAEALVGTGPSNSAGWRRRLVLTGIAAGLGLATVVVERHPNNHPKPPSRC